MSVCPKCEGRKYIELDKIGLLVTTCPECIGTGVKDDSNNRIGQDNQNLRSPSPSKPRKPRQRKKSKVA